MNGQRKDLSVAQASSSPAMHGNEQKMAQPPNRLATIEHEHEVLKQLVGDLIAELRNRVAFLESTLGIDQCGDTDR